VNCKYGLPFRESWRKTAGGLYWCQLPPEYMEGVLKIPYLINDGQITYFWTLKKLLGYWLSRLSIDTLKIIIKFKKNFQKNGKPKIN
jgi:hypothetical protein